MESKKREREVTDLATDVVTSVPSKKARIESNRSLFVRSLGPSVTSESLLNFVSQHYPVKHATVVPGRGYGFLTFADAEDCVEAKEKLNNELLEGRRIKLESAERRQRSNKSGDAAVPNAKAQREEALREARRAPKLIIRNLPWSIKSGKDLAAIFQSYGKVKFADLPQSKGKLSGFGFVTLRQKAAVRALEELNGKIIDGRTIAVDYAVDKATWEKEKQKEGGAQEAETEPAEPTEGKSSKKAKKSKDNEKVEEMTQEDADLANFMKNHMENLEEEEESDLDQEDKDDDDEGGAELDGSDALEDEDEKENDQDDEAEEPTPKRTSDNSAVVFIRNLPFSTQDADLKAHFSKFGPIRYGRIVMDRATDRPAGTGFVAFYNLEDCEACLKGAPRHVPTTTLAKRSILQDETVDQDGRYTLDGRVLQVSQAVDKAEATRLAETGPGAKNLLAKDKRRLFLLSEGSIQKSSPLFNLLPAAEVKLREQSATQRKKMIQSNPSLHLSLTRLALRNIPHNIDSKELKGLARQAVVGFAKDVKEERRQPLSKEEIARSRQEDKAAEHLRKAKGQGIVRQAKVVFESQEGSKVPEKAGAGRSRGYGFIEYTSHRNALMGLRWLNGHALKNEAGKTMRLIVEFAIENATVVQRRRMLEDKSREPNKPVAAGAATRGAASGSSFKGRPADKPKGAKKWGKEKADDKVPEAAEVADGDKAGAKNADAKLALRTKIIARKRMMRKKKTELRRGK